VISWFQGLLSKFNLYRYVMEHLSEMTRREGLWFGNPLKHNWRNVSVNGGGCTAVESIACTHLLFVVRTAVVQLLYP
jgi:hypothetical protein